MAGYNFQAFVLLSNIYPVTCPCFAFYLYKFVHHRTHFKEKEMSMNNPILCKVPPNYDYTSWFSSVCPVSVHLKTFFSQYVTLKLQLSQFYPKCDIFLFPVSLKFAFVAYIIWTLFSAFYYGIVCLLAPVCHL